MRSLIHALLLAKSLVCAHQISNIYSREIGPFQLYDRHFNTIYDKRDLEYDIYGRDPQQFFLIHERDLDYLLSKKDPELHDQSPSPSNVSRLFRKDTHGPTKDYDCDGKLPKDLCLSESKEKDSLTSQKGTTFKSGYILNNLIRAAAHGREQEMRRDPTTLGMSNNGIKTCTCQNNEPLSTSHSQNATAHLFIEN